MDPGCAGGGGDAFWSVVGRVGSEAVGYVLGCCGGEDGGILRHDDDEGAQRGRVDVFDVAAGEGEVAEFAL